MSLAADSSPPGEYYCPSCEKTFQVGERCPNDGTKLVRLSARLDPFLGRELDGSYTILEKLGQGGMGAVYRASQHSVGREVAVKVVSAHLVSDPDVVKRFLREAKLASRLSHPNAVGVIDFGQTDDGVFYLVMELVTGRTLDQVIKAERVFKPERVVRIGTQVCDALEGAHALQIVHRDLKPSNIMLLSSGRDLVKVLDFGLAKSVAPDQASTTMTNAGALLGTPAFMPPEIALGQPCDRRADLYSLGVILYLLGTGKLPFVSESAHELIAMHGTEPAPRMTGVPPALASVIDRLLAKDPDDRFQTAAETREALEAALENRHVTPLPFETSPSLGPFPLTTSAIMGAAESAKLPVTPKPRSATEISRLVNQDTIAADTPFPTRPRRKRGALVAALLGAVVAAGAAVFVVGGGIAGHGPLSTSEPVATPKAEPPKTEPPKTEPPKTEPPKAEPPQAEPPTAEPPTPNADVTPPPLAKDQRPKTKDPVTPKTIKHTPKTRAKQPPKERAEPTTKTPPPPPPPPDPIMQTPAKGKLPF